MKNEFSSDDSPDDAGDVNMTSSCEDAQQNKSWRCPYTLDSKPIDVQVNGFILPVVVTVTIVTNSLICLVLLQRHMRTPTNLLLVAMAVSDALTGALPVPSFIYFYTAGHYRDYVPYAWCHASVTLTLNLPTVCHTASIWLTVALAGQRYLYVCHSPRAKTLCTIPNTVKVIAAVYAAAFVSQASRFFEYRYVAVRVESLVDDGLEFDGCYDLLVPFLQRYDTAYFNLYWWFRVVFIHLVPCASLVVLSSLLYNAMRVAQRRRRVLLRQNRRTECRRLAETNMATLMLVVVVCVFLVVELPLAFLLITMIFENTFHWSFMRSDDRDVASIVINLIILFSYPLNFFIYCAMSRQFRETFKRSFSCRRQTQAGARAKANNCHTTCQTTRI